ncbi:D-glycero-beta-D-manno-heptose 1,7-bisphosphate 7-phosphatase [Dyella sp. 2HG41-7]|uniref:D-glycero-beta-D-manno-heptose 1,7-bisphosphate 7-phosphatase n=1 Tax=Dyella sp. 2HG41-7 TaxID=2883239 RepID=UPI001F1E591C|nr:D-glycero-beta-D-manno-heptose 1,7-bisphosphate 7-phosphatase [Dyella sp. 2HG41-7]
MTASGCPRLFELEAKPALPRHDRKKALFLDRDGVINVNHGYVHTPGQTDWVDGIFQLCRIAQNADYQLVVVTNQAGIARGYYTEAAYLTYTRWMHGQFAERGIRLLATYYCPHHPEGLGEWRLNCECRKPQPGMILAAADRYDIDLSASVMVGDNVSDLQASQAAGVGAYVMIDEAMADKSRVFPGAQPR